MKIKRNILIFCIVVFTLLFIIKVFNDVFSSICDYYCSSFDGKITEVRYTEQKHIKVFVNEKWIPLGLNIKYDIEVEVGDIVSKESNSYITILNKNGLQYNISSDRNTKKFDKYCKCNN